MYSQPATFSQGKSGAIAAVSPSSAVPRLPTATVGAEKTGAVTLPTLCSSRGVALRLVGVESLSWASRYCLHVASITTSRFTTLYFPLAGQTLLDIDGF